MARFIRTFPDIPGHSRRVPTIACRRTPPHDGAVAQERIRGFEELVERQREWPLEAGARVALVVHALPPAVAAVVLALGTGLM